MPKRFLDADAMWTSNRLARCKKESVPEYAWLYGLADAWGNFEMTNFDVLWKNAYAGIRKHVTVQDMVAFLRDFRDNGLLYTWRENGKLIGHWTGCETGQRLPSPGQRNRYSGNVPTMRNETRYSGSGAKGDPRIPAEPGLVEYLVRTAPQTENHPFDDETPVNGNYEKGALSKVPPVSEEQAQQLAADDQLRINAWHEFKSLYPIDTGMSIARTIFDELARHDSSIAIAIVEGLKRWLDTEKWQEGIRTKNLGFMPHASTFLKRNDWNDKKLPVGGGVNGGPRVVGTIGESYQDGIDRIQGNRETILRDLAARRSRS